MDKEEAASAKAANLQRQLSQMKTQYEQKVAGLKKDKLHLEDQLSDVGSELYIYIYLIQWLSKKFTCQIKCKLYKIKQCVLVTFLVYLRCRLSRS